MIRKLPVIALLVGAFAVAGQAQAHGYYGHGGGCCWGGGWGAPLAVGAVVGAVVAGSVVANSQRPVYVQQPVSVQPQPVYVQPQPVYVQPAPVYVPPQPGYYIQPRY
jgi:hypothetical protein